MAKIGIENIAEIQLKVLKDERTYNSDSIHELVRKIYEEKGYDSAPKSRKEADELGVKNFNGLMSSFVSIEVTPQEVGNLVIATIAPTRYLVGQAMRDVMKEAKENNIIYTPEVIVDLSPDMANVSLVAPVKINGEYFLLSQIKGRALGSGQVHTGLVAGNINAKYLRYDNPLVATLQNECSEEIGMDLSSLNPSSFVYMVDERETGQVNFAAVAQNVDLGKVLENYEKLTKPKLTEEIKLEVMALATLTVKGLVLTPLEDGSNGLKGVICYFPTKDGLEKKVEDRGVRPYTQATIDYLSKKENVKFLLEKAGI
ncbi:hypothetical protein DRJ22_05030 [Candidatus Woesearchaeota archaeon]|nr:MAG: hypothetical protein DRJ22_05030 [Candidatus Woesearchaeota archaeon]